MDFKEKDKVGSRYVIQFFNSSDFVGDYDRNAFMYFGAIVWGAVVLVCKLMGFIQVSGWTTLFIFNLCSFGIIMVTLGILGGYLWRTFDASRNRPTYITRRRK